MMWDREKIPTSADVLIIGGGIIGTASAYYLARLGMSVVLIEKDKIACQQSGHNWGFVRTQNRDPAELPLSIEALSLWPTLERELGVHVGWRQCGCIFVAERESEQSTFERWHSTTRDIASDTRLLSAREVAARVPALKATVAGGLYTHSDGQADPLPATRAFAVAARALGARIIEDCGALSIEVAAGSVHGAMTEHGMIHSNSIVCASGATAYRLLRPHGILLPQQVVRNTVSLTTPVPVASEACFCGLGLGLRQRPDGSCVLSAESAVDVDITLDSFRESTFFLPSLLLYRETFSLSIGRPLLDDLCDRIRIRADRRAIEPRQCRAVPNRRRAAANADLFRRLFRSAEDFSIVTSWARQIDVLPDALPVIDGASKIRGLVVATGFSGHGFGLGPAVGRTVAELASGSKVQIPLDPFRLDRFERREYGRPHAPL